MAREIQTKVKNAVLYTDGLIRIENVRLSYPHLAKAYKGDDQDGEARFSVVGLMNKKTHAAALQLIVKCIDGLLKEKNKGAKIPKDKKFCRDGDDTGKEDYEGFYTINASETKRPSVRGRAKETLSTEEIEQMFYGGCWGTILIRPWFQDNKFGKRVNANLIACQFLRNDTAFGEGRISEDEIDESLESYEDDDEGGSGDDDDNGGL